MQFAPIVIKRDGTESVEIEWNDGHRSVYLNRYLRDNCPCASCREGQPKRALPILDSARQLYPVQISVVGRYAISIRWSDGHDTGIYSYETLRQLCPCQQCHPTRPQETTA
ncbi:MAG: DUF971 domain-containing protein [Candidatus Binatia bacterium]